MLSKYRNELLLILLALVCRHAEELSELLQYVDRTHERWRKVKASRTNCVGASLDNGDSSGYVYSKIRAYFICVLEHGLC